MDALPLYVTFGGLCAFALVMLGLVRHSEKAEKK